MSTQIPDVSCRDLEYDPRELERVVNPRNPRYFPKLNVTRELERTSEDIVIELYHQIFEHANSNPLYRFLFNVVAYKDFENDHFDDLAQFALGCFILASDRNRRVEVRRLIPDAVDMALKFTIGLYYRDSRKFQDELDASNKDHNQLMDAARDYFEVIEHVEDILDPRGGRGRDRDYRDDRRGGRDRDDYRNARGFGTRNPDRDERRDRDSERDSRLSRRDDRDDRGSADDGLFRERGNRRERERTTEDTGGGFGIRNRSQTTEATTRTEPTSNMRRVSSEEARAEVAQIEGRHPRRESARDAARETPAGEVQTHDYIDGKRIMKVMKDNMILLEDNTRLTPYDGRFGTPRTVDRPYLPAWNENRESAFYVIDENGNAVDIKIYPLKEVKMNREEHKTAAVARAERESELNKAAFNETQEVAVKPADVTSLNLPNARVTHTFANSEESVTSLKTAELNLDLLVADVAQASAGRPAALTATGNLIEVVSNMNESTFSAIDVLRQCKSLANAREILESAYTVDPQITVDTIDGLDIINQRLTNAVNDYVRHEMDCEFSISDFKNDFLDLVEAVKQDYGDSTAQCLRVSMKPLHAALGESDTAIADYVTMADSIGLSARIDEAAQAEKVAAQEADSEAVLNEEDYVRGGARWEALCKELFKQRGILLVDRPYFLTALNVSGDQLGISKRDVVQGLTVQNQPILAKIATQVYKHRAIKQIKGPYTHIVKTADGIRYEFTPSAINDTMTMVRRLN